MLTFGPLIWPTSEPPLSLVHLILRLCNPSALQLLLQGKHGHLACSLHGLMLDRRLLQSTWTAGSWQRE